ncbi:phosphoribosyltransferase-like protein [Serratia marcescens]|uniref:PRTase-CE domain-containing protein n=1 Tax=Serratia marcescens TaxID=615 RepID=A0ABD5ICC7_SERMA|nr:hypothetical protein [Serratia marcescens]MDX7081670.1 hypothetical protein [Serratia marcescens]
MTIAAAKIPQEVFKDLMELLEHSPWLKHYYNPLIELWNFCDLSEQQKLLKELLFRFRFIDSFQLDEIGREVAKHISQKLGLKPINTKIAAISDNDKPDGSVAGIQFLKNKFSIHDNWKESNFISSITSAAHNAKNNDNIILFDDFIGSGKTINNKLSYFKLTLKERKIKLNSLRVVSFAAMDFGLKKIKEDSGLDAFSVIVLKKGITECNSPEEAEKKINLMIDLEKKLKPTMRGLKIRDHSLGYGRSETLFQISGYNCPNNLFPIFWWPLDKDLIRRDTLFNRAK